MEAWKQVSNHLCEESAISPMKWKGKGFPRNLGKQCSSPVFLYAMQVFYSAYPHVAVTLKLLCCKKKGIKIKQTQTKANKKANRCHHKT